MPQPPVATSMAGNFSQQQQQQPANFMTPAPIQQQPQQQQQPRAAAPAPAQPKEILPIPQEHLDLQTTFDGLRLKCISAASHPVGNLLSCHVTSLFDRRAEIDDEDERQRQCVFSLQQTRRKLEDVGKKLEILYDKLREHVVSEEEGFWMASLELELGPA